MKSNVQTALLSLEGLLKYLSNFKESCKKVLFKAIEICEKNSIEVKFEDQKRSATGRLNVTNEENFYGNVFKAIIESTINSITERFNALKNNNGLFSFLYDFKNYEANRINGSLLKSCEMLEVALTHEGKSNIDGNDLFIQLATVSTLVKNENIVHVIDILNAIQSREMENLVPNAVIAFRILFTIPVSVASGERSFSKLKLIKTYLRNVMSQNRLNELSIILIEKDIANLIDYDDIIEQFAASKARKKEFS